MVWQKVDIALVGDKCELGWEGGAYRGGWVVRGCSELMGDVNPPCYIVLHAKNEILQF